MKNKKILLALSAATALAAASSASAASNEIYAGVGTTGLGVGYAYGVNDRFSVRGQYDGMNYDGTYHNSGSDYKGKLDMSQAGVYGDYFPFAGTFRITAGFVHTSSSFSGEADGGSGTVQINHVSYSLAGESARIKIDLPSDMPYLGVGWGHNATKAGFGFFADLGLLFGNPKTHISLSPGLAAQVPPSDVTSEEHSINDDVKVLGGYPVATVGFSYNF